MHAGLHADLAKKIGLGRGGRGGRKAAPAKAEAAPKAKAAAKPGAQGDAKPSKRSGLIKRLNQKADGEAASTSES